MLTSSFFNLPTSRHRMRDFLRGFPNPNISMGDISNNTGIPPHEVLAILEQLPGFAGVLTSHGLEVKAVLAEITADIKRREERGEYRG